MAVSPPDVIRRGLSLGPVRQRHGSGCPFNRRLLSACSGGGLFLEGRYDVLDEEFEGAFLLLVREAIV